MRRLTLLLITISIFLYRAAEVRAASAATNNAEHVVLVVWDGLRPDSVTESSTPTLYQLARDGVFFQNHHSVYLSATEVNGTAMATGDYPNRSGIFANRDYRPAINPLQRVEIEAASTIAKGDEISGGHYLLRPTFPEILQQMGQPVALAGSKPVAILFNRFDRAHITQPDNPRPKIPNTETDAVTTRTLVESRWKDGVPAFSLLWLSEPDASQHSAGPGSSTALQALKGSDDNLARLLKELDARGLRSKTDVLVASDHGFSTISRAVELDKVLTAAGFNATREFKEPPKDGDVMVVGNGGSALLYVIGHDLRLIRQLVEFLQQQDFTGVIFTRTPMRGTFTLDQIRINTANAPDIVVALRWWPDKSTTGLPGLLVNIGDARGPGQGAHASLSPFDMRATLVAAGPDFRRGMVDQLPSGNPDLAPTILHILGLEPTQPLDGRVLVEALRASSGSLPAVELQTLEASNDLDKAIWHQYLRTTEFFRAIYFDEGNGSAISK